MSCKGDNYAEWRAAWMIAFRFAELWDVITDGKPPAIAESATAEQIADSAQWRKNDNKAMVIIMSAVHPDIVMLVTTAASAHQAWTTLQDRYDRDTAHSTIQQFRQLTSMRYNEDDDLMQHLDTFHRAHNLL
ncbi:retrovirus-related pol poly from transposon tnt 1-94 [Trichoderma arundinaceum]|uniref:Retrovirus-related pol poly from transposon tnt 1-94 n=1 Tax=Trichoderma arundinaceum TaxID=490622 RepID=A0A395N878_TRIAR|nr:retrovirus-related pol poly from transposon tnt 1-94 [Trichoderma arundinaceum]